MAIVEHAERRCSNCVHGHQLSSVTRAVSIESEHERTEWIYNPVPIGQTRHCFNFWQKTFLKPETFIYPGHDDTCINPKRYSPKLK